jgi:ArsR family transcriptional regulator, arsenate/arsenite/antimonite-responsive transcriptional repressor
MTVQSACCVPLVQTPLDEEGAAELSHILKALADPARLRLISLIGANPGGEVCVCDLAAAFSLKQPTISHHLKVLREAGLIESERRATWIYYRLVPGRLNRIADLLTVSAPADLTNSTH